MNGVGWDVLVVLAFILIGGFFAAAEMALVSLREGQVRALAKRGKRGQRAARLAHDPNRFLSAVQIGVTVATLAVRRVRRRDPGRATSSAARRTRSAAHVADVLSFVVVTLVIAFFSLVLGELVPKSLALLLLGALLADGGAPALYGLSRIARPLVWS